MNSLSGIKLITIDLDDTLWPCRPTIDAAEQAIFDWLDLHAPAVTRQHDVLTLREERMALRRDNQHIAHDLTALRLLSLQQLMREFGYHPSLADRGLAHFLEHRNKVEPFAEVAEVLQRLGRRYCLVSLTNGNADVEQTPLKGLFHHAIRAEDAGAAKPDPAMFHAAFRWAGISAAESLHLGDDPHLDVVAARSLGMRAVWVNRYRASWPDEVPSADACIEDLSEIWSYLESV